MFELLVYLLAVVAVLVLAAEPANTDDISDLLSIKATPEQIDWESHKATQLRAIGSLYGVPGAARATKAKLIQALAQ